MSEEGAPQAGASDKRARAEEVLGDILGHMGVRARLEVKDVAGDSPSISVAIFPDDELPGVAAGKRSQVVDALQFLVNKIVNRGPDKKWINIGVGGHPEPRAPKEKAPPQQPKAKQAAAAPAAAAPAAPAEPRQKKGKKERSRAGEAKEGRPPRPAAEPDESSLEVADDPAMAALGRALAEKSASAGRVFAVTAMATAPRAQLTRGAQGVAGVRLKTEGEGRHRRVVFLPDNPKPMPKKSAMPDYDEEEELEG